MIRIKKRKVGFLIFSKKKSKKANMIIEVIVVFVILFILGIFMVVFYNAFSPVQEDLINEFNSTGSNQSVEAIEQGYDAYPSLWDGFFIFLFVFMWIATIFGAFFIDSHPIFFVIGILLILPTIIVAVVLGNTYELFMEDAAISSLRSVFPMSYWILTHSLPIAIVMTLSIGGVLYAKYNI